MRALGIVLLLALPALAGCLGAGAPASPAADAPPREDLPVATTASPPPAQDGPPATTEPDARAAVAPEAAAPPADMGPVLEQYGCTTVAGIFDAPRAWAEARLPEGFGLLRGPGGGAMLMAKVWACEAARIGDLDVASPAVGAYSLGVVPPEGLRGEAVVFWLPLWYIATDPDEAALYERWNLAGTGEGAVDIEVVAATLGTAMLATVASGDGRLEFTTLAAGAEASGPYLVRYFGVRDGRVAGIVEIAVTAARASAWQPATLRLEGADAPFEGLAAGEGGQRTWEPAALSYTWTQVPLP